MSTNRRLIKEISRYSYGRILYTEYLRNIMLNFKKGSYKGLTHMAKTGEASSGH